MPCLSGLDRDDEHLSAEDQRKRDTLIEMQMEGLGIRRCCSDHPTRDFKETKTGAGNATTLETKSELIDFGSAAGQQARKINTWEAAFIEGHPYKLARSDTKRPETWQAFWGLPPSCTTKPPIHQAITALMSLNPAVVRPSIGHSSTSKAMNDLNLGQTPKVEDKPLGEEDDYVKVEVNEDEDFEKVEQDEAEMAEWEEI